MNTNKIKEASRELLQAIKQILKTFYRIKAHCWTLQKCVCAPRQRSLIHFTLGLFAWCRHVNVAKFVTPPRTAVLRSRGGVTHSGETRLVLPHGLPLHNLKYFVFVFKLPTCNRTMSCLLFSDTKHHVESVKNKIIAIGMMTSGLEHKVL